MLRILIISTLLFVISLPGSFSQQVEHETNGAEEVDPDMYFGFTTNYFTIWSRRPFDWKGASDRHPLPDNRTGTSRSSFSMTLHFGYELNEETHLGLFFDHRSFNRRTELIIDPNGNELIPFSTNRDINGPGVFLRYRVYQHHDVDVYLRPSLGYYFDAYEEYRESIREYREENRYILFGLGVGLQYEVIDNLRLVFRFSGLNYINGKWSETGSERGESYAETSFNLGRSGLFFGAEWRF